LIAMFIISVIVFLLFISDFFLFFDVLVFIKCFVFGLSFGLTHIYTSTLRREPEKVRRIV
jgi:hypothetical protein